MKDYRLSSCPPRDNGVREFGGFAAVLSKLPYLEEIIADAATDRAQPERPGFLRTSFFLEISAPLTLNPSIFYGAQPGTSSLVN